MEIHSDSRGDFGDVCAGTDLCSDNAGSLDQGKSHRRAIMIEFAIDHPDTDDAAALLPGDQGFDFINGMVRYERATLLINPDCPDSVRDLIIKASSRGWLQPVAYMKQEEWAWARMAGDH